MNLRAKLLRNFVLPLGDAAFGQQMISRLKFLETVQYWPQEQIFEKQKELLQNVVNVSYREVPFYQKLMDEKGIKPSDIRVPSDLTGLAVVTKDMLRAGYPNEVTRKTGQKTYEASTSGSTGKNFFVMEDAYTAGWYRATFLLQLEWAGWQLGTPHLQTGMTLNRSLDRRLKDWIFGCHYFSAFNLDNFHLDRILDEIERFNLKFLFGYPGSLYFLAKRAKELGWNTPLVSAVTWGDSLYPKYRNLIEETFQTKVFDTYGCGEGIQIAAQCEYGNYHLHSLDAIVEFLDDEGQSVPTGSVGNIVVTRLHPGPMPLIRYAIGDLGVASDSKICPCGRNLPMMQSIQGRNADVIITPSGNRLIVHYFTGILEHFSEIDQFQVVQNDPGSILIRIVAKTDITPALKASVIEAIKQKGAADLTVHFEVVDQIEVTSTGKHRFIINNVPSR